ncbi:MAG: hypothetical protein HQL30_04800 [Candidatus Omnitrophica bacterium]|nr:hypothetical protein [Candidatus Omnitrophota bacterium]
MRNCFLFMLMALTLALLSACAGIRNAPRNIMGFGYADLIQLKSSGKIKEVPLSKADAFNKVIALLNEKAKLDRKKGEGEDKLKVFMSDLNDGYIVIMGLPKQTPTTRVGIFFDSKDNSTTTVTLSSDSSTALTKAETLIFTSL